MEMKIHGLFSTTFLDFFICVRKCKKSHSIYGYFLINFLINLFTGLIFLVLFSNYCFTAQAQEVRSILHFGARGDGITDDYAALQQAAKWLCSVPNSHLNFPEGNYLIDRYRITGGRFKNDVQNIQFKGCNYVKISGNKAKILVKGDFHRAADVEKEKYSESYSAGVIPFEFLNSSNFVINGFELDGNANLTTKDPTVAEASNAGIQTTNCKNYVIENVIVHHFLTDGITLGANSVKADQKALLKNVELRNNARQGLSIIQLRDGYFLDSKFHNNGRTEGKYGYHLPAAGVDVEPVRASPPEDIQTGDLIFEKCEFYDNIGSQFISVWPEKVDSITVRFSKISATREDSDPVAFVNSAANSLVEDNEFFFKGKHGVSLAVLRSSGFPFLKEIVYRKNKFFINHPLSIYSPESQSLPILFDGNEVNIQDEETFSEPIRIKGLKEFTGNSFVIRNEGGQGKSRRHQILIRFSKIKVLRDNTYRLSERNMGIHYDGISGIRNEKYEGAEPILR